MYEDRKNGSLIASIRAIDYDKDSKICYKLKGGEGHFEINHNTVSLSFRIPFIYRVLLFTKIFRNSALVFIVSFFIIKHTCVTFLSLNK